MAHICMIHVYIYNYVHINTVLLELQRKYNIIIARRVKAFASCSHQTLDCAIGARESNKINILSSTSIKTWPPLRGCFLSAFPYS